MPCSHPILVNQTPFKEATAFLGKVGDILAHWLPSQLTIWPNALRVSSGKLCLSPLQCRAPSPSVDICCCVSTLSGESLFPQRASEEPLNHFTVSISLFPHFCFPTQYPKKKTTTPMLLLLILASDLGSLTHARQS